MEGIVVMVVFGVLIGCVGCQENVDTSYAGVYMVTLKQAPSAFALHNYKPSRVKKTTRAFGFLDSTSNGANTLDNPR